MARPHAVGTSAINRLIKLRQHEAVFQSKLALNKPALKLAVEYVFLSAFKEWENFLEQTFISQSRFNDPINGKRLYPYLAPKSITHAYDLMTLEKDYIDWTSSDHVIKRADILFRNSAPITDPLKSNQQFLRDVKKIRNFIAHGSTESRRIFKSICVRNISRNVNDAGEYLLSTPTGASDHFAVLYINQFIELVELMSN